MAIQDRRVVPAQREWAEGEALRDPAAFAKFLETAPQLDIALFAEIGGSGTAPVEDKQKVGEWIEAKVAEKVSLKDAQAMAQKHFSAEEFKNYRYQPR